MLRYFAPELPPQRPPLRKIDTWARENLELWFHLALRPCRAPMAIAVTGRVEEDAIRSIVFTQNNLGLPVSSRSTVQHVGRSTDFISHALTMSSTIGRAYRCPNSMKRFFKFKFVIYQVASEARAKIEIGKSGISNQDNRRMVLEKEALGLAHTENFRPGSGIQIQSQGTQHTAR